LLFKLLLQQHGQSTAQQKFGCQTEIAVIRRQSPDMPRCVKQEYPIHQPETEWGGRNRQRLMSFKFDDLCNHISNSVKSRDSSMPDAHARIIKLLQIAVAHCACDRCGAARLF
jgi:hypothetical protein